MITQDSLNQLEELLIEEQCFHKKNGTTSAFTENMICRCKHIINNMDTPPEIFFNENNAIELIYKTENIYIVVEICKNDYGMFMEIDNTRCGWVSLSTKRDVVNWWNTLIEMSPKQKRDFIKFKELR